MDVVKKIIVSMMIAATINCSQPVNTVPALNGLLALLATRMQPPVAAPMPAALPHVVHVNPVFNINPIHVNNYGQPVQPALLGKLLAIAVAHSVQQRQAFQIATLQQAMAALPMPPALPVPPASATPSGIVAHSHTTHSVAPQLAAQGVGAAAAAANSSAAVPIRNIVCKCNERFNDPTSYKNHVIQKHFGLPESEFTRESLLFNLNGFLKQGSLEGVTFGLLDTGITCKCLKVFKTEEMFQRHIVSRSNSDHARLEYDGLPKLTKNVQGVNAFYNALMQQRAQEEMHQIKHEKERYEALEKHRNEVRRVLQKTQAKSKNPQPKKEHKRKRSNSKAVISDADGDDSDDSDFTSTVCEGSDDEQPKAKRKKSEQAKKAVAENNGNARVSASPQSASAASAAVADQSSNNNAQSTVERPIAAAAALAVVNDQAQALADERMKASVDKARAELAAQSFAPSIEPVEKDSLDIIEQDFQARLAEAHAFAGIGDAQKHQKDKDLEEWLDTIK